MKKLISFKVAKNASIIILLLVTLFNVLVIVGFVPYDMVWGGRLTSKEEMIVFELISIIVNLVSIFIVMLKSGSIFPNLSKLPKILSWMLPVIYFFGILGKKSL